MAIIQMPATEEEWKGWRKKNIGGSEAAALLGFQADFALSPLALYLIKRGEIPEPEIDSELIRAGHRMEPVAADWACEENGWVQLPAVYATDDTTPGMAASLDRVVMPSDEDEAAGYIGPGALECKNVLGWTYTRKWEDDEPPPYILIQLQHQLACSGYSWGAVAGIVHGHSLRVVRYHRNEEIIAAIRSAVTNFWEAVRAGRPPSPDGFKSTTEALRARNPVLIEEKTIDLSASNELPMLARRHAEIEKLAKALKKEDEEIKNRFRSEMGNARYAVLADGTKVSHSIGQDTPDRTAKPGEIIKGRRGQDRVTITLSKEAA